MARALKNRDLPPRESRPRNTVVTKRTLGHRSQYPVFTRTSPFSVLSRLSVTSLGLSV